MNDSKRDDRRSSRVGRLIMVLIAVSLIAIGGLFIALMGRSYLRAKEMRDWPVVSCVILESTVQQRQHDPYSPPEYSHRITFGYEWEGESYTGERISLRGTKWSSKPQAVQDSLERYPAGSVQDCHISPDDPSLAVLETDSLAPLYSIWFPALFVAGGVGVLITALRSRNPSAAGA